MKKIILCLILLLSFFTFSFDAEAAVRVKGYFRKDGTYVQPHYRSNSDGNPYNNYSFPGNTNPYTGKTATGDASVYLNNYYDKYNSYTAYTPVVLPSKNVSYVTKLWSDNNPGLNCNQSTFLRAKERLECDLFRTNKNNYTWNITTNEFDYRHYRYDSSNQTTFSCPDGYAFLYDTNNGKALNCTKELI